MSRILRAEWTKLRTVPSTAWLLAAVVALTLALGVAAVASVDTEYCPTPTTCAEDTARLSLTGVWLGQAAVAVLAVLAVTNEYASGLIRSTLAASPSRVRVLTGKVAVVTATVLAAAVVGVAGSVLAARAILPSNGFTPANGYALLSLSDGPTLRAAAGSVLYLGLVAVIAVGIATIARGTAVALTAALTVLYAVPLLVRFVSDPGWQERLQRWSPSSAGLAIQATTGLDRLPIQPWAGLGVLAGYAAVALACAAALFRARDAG